MSVILAAARWALRALATSPPAWAGLAALAALWPGILVLSRYGVTAGDGAADRAVFEVVHVGLLLGGMLGLGLVERSSALWELHPARQRLLARFGVLSVTVLVGALAAALGPLALPAVREDLGGLAGRTLLSALHLVALGLVIARLPGIGSARIALLPLAAWVVPALLSPNETVGPLARHVLAAGRHLQPTPDGEFNTAGWMAPLLPIIGLGLVAAVRREEP